MRSLCRFRLLWSFLLILLLHNVSFAVEKLVIEADRDTAYLPYRLAQTPWQEDNSARTKTIHRPLQVLLPEIENKQSGIVITAGNPHITTDLPATFPMKNYADWSVLQDNAVNLIVGDWQIYNADFGRSPMIVGAGYKRDSAFVFRSDLNTGREMFRYLSTGDDRVGDGEWNPQIRLLLLEDYDFDGKQEVFVNVNSELEQGPRELYCIELESLEIEWSLPVASPPVPGNYFSIQDSLNPGVIFVTNNPGQNRFDANFDDHYRYLAIIDSNGLLVRKRLLAEEHCWFQLVKAAEPGGFYITHEKKHLAYDSTTYAEPRVRYVSLIDGQGNIHKTAEYTGKPFHLWTDTYENLEFAIFLKTSNDRICTYDADLELMAEADAAGLRRYIGVISIYGLGECRIFSDGIYLKKPNGYDKIAAFPFEPVSVAPLEIDTLGNVLSIGLNAPSRYMVAEIHQRSTIELLSVFYHRNQPYVLMALSGLLVGLVMMNYFRRRTKGNLRLIARQKQELEQTHRELVETQEKLVAAEKYRQAKDIAGGFAHEINNALYPASKLPDMVADCLGQTNPADVDRGLDLLRRIKASVARAQQMTELVLAYSKLETEKKLNNVNLRTLVEEVTASNQIRLNEMDVEVISDIKDDVLMSCNPIHAFSVFNNLMQNAIDAMDGNEHRTIHISAENSNEQVKITFSDSGHGISAELTDKIFDMFFTTKPAKGKGLGLSMVKKIVALYNGSVEVQSLVHSGTTFTLKFPRVPRLITT